MPFEPHKITKKHIVDAINKIEKEYILIEPALDYDVKIGYKRYSAEEVLKYAHQEMNGEFIWEETDKSVTNSYLSSLGFEIIDKSMYISDTIWKLGCNWGSKKPNFYEFIRQEGIVIGVNQKEYAVNDLIVIAVGHRVKALAKINETPKPVTTSADLKDRFEVHKIPYENWVNFASAKWYELDADNEFDYQLQQGICKVQNHNIRQKVKELWKHKNTNYWVFQGNPDQYDINTALTNNLIDNWRVTAHKNVIKAGDKVIIWISGKKGGCYALAEVTHAPKVLEKSQDTHLWKVEDTSDLKAGIRITHNLVNNPIPFDLIKSVAGLEHLKVGLQGSNFSATKSEYDIIKDLIISYSQTTNPPPITMHPLNTILYGPPGTGKTYNSIDKAVEIATGSTSGDHISNKKVFDNLKEKGQIEFVTFHQNYSYEDFVVGITPDISSGILRFEKREGIFKQLAEKAKQNWLAATKRQDELPLDFNHIFNSFFSKLIEEEISEVEIPMKSKGFTFKVTSIDVDAGRIKFAKQSGGTGHDLLVKNVKAIYDGSLDYGFEGLGVYYYPLVEQLKEYASTFHPEKSTDTTLKNYVLVIDEINRGNISKIFGELITLLEDDKRLGGENELHVTLPNGEKDFSIPPNLYIIGTMNTADKSIALIDIALRRRFEFIGYYPEYEGYEPEAISLLQSINSAVFEKKKSADYLIGHAYFMKQKPIQTVLQNKVIPLLMEYFSGKIDIVKSIFNNSGWIVSYDYDSYTWNFTKATV